MTPLKHLKRSWKRFVADCKRQAEIERLQARQEAVIAIKEGCR